MLDMIRQEYEYHDWANHQILDVARGLDQAQLQANLGGSFNSLMKTLSHILLVEMLFVKRLQKLPVDEVRAFETIEEIANAWRQVETERSLILEQMEEDDLRETIHYVDTRGRSVSLVLWQLLFQCVNHSTFHRGQVVEKLRQIETTPPTTDYVLYCRGLEK
jgi:uncharacterized damage-inducible protein DinB